MVLSPEQFFTLTGQAKGSFKASVSRGETALAFGTEKELAGGKFLDLDVVACCFSDKLTPAFGRKLASTLVRCFSDKWVAAVHRAERERVEPIWLVVVETGKLLKRSDRINVLGKSADAPRLVHENMNVGFGTLPEAGTAMRKGKVTPERMTFINVTSLVADLRCRADHHGIRLPEVIVPDLDRPEFATAMADVKSSREALVGRSPTTGQE